LKQLADIYPDEYVHLGGDEVAPFCWLNDSSIKKYLDDNNMTTDQFQVWGI